MASENLVALGANLSAESTVCLWMIRTRHCRGLTQGANALHHMIDFPQTCASIKGFLLVYEETWAPALDLATARMGCLVQPSQCFRNLPFKNLSEMATRDLK